MVDQQTAAELSRIEQSKPTDAKKEKKLGEEAAGIAYIYTSFNNTIVHITDLSGSTVSRISGGQVTKQDRLKANPTVAMFVAKKGC